MVMSGKQMTGTCKGIIGSLPNKYPPIPAITVAHRMYPRPVLVVGTCGPSQPPTHPRSLKAFCGAIFSGI